RDRGTPGGGPVALRGQGRPGRIAWHVHDRRNGGPRRRRHGRGRRAERGLRSDEAREVGRHRDASHVLEPVTGAGRISGEATRLESMKRNQRAKFVQGNERKFAFISFSESRLFNGLRRKNKKF